MIERNARFYFANLCADVFRCAAAAEKNDVARYEASLGQAWRTIDYIRNCRRPEAYEEALLLLRALEYAKTDGTLRSFRQQLDKIAASLAIV